MAGKVRVVINVPPSRVRSVVAPLSRRAVLNATQVTRERARSNLTQGGHFDKGELDRSLTFKEISTDPMKPRFVVGASAKHAKFLEFGTKGHGPVRAKFLRFKPKGSAAYVFAKWVRGIKSVRFMRRALRALTIYDFKD